MGKTPVLKIGLYVQLTNVPRHHPYTAALHGNQTYNTTRPHADLSRITSEV